MGNVCKLSAWAEREWSTAATPHDRYVACKAMARGYAESRKLPKVRLDHARAFCSVVVESFWVTLCERQRCRLAIKPSPLSLPTLTQDVRRVAEQVGRLITEFPIENAGYLIGSIYTAMLPESVRSDMGAYYTPPCLVGRMLDMAEAAGFNFATGTAIDPACGGGAFLAPVALRMVSKNPGTAAAWALRDLGNRLRGLELDPFAAWMTTVLLEAAVLPLCISAERRMADVVEVGDALTPRETGQFDLVIGNPPYGRVRLHENTRKHYERSLYGHANLYGLFTDLGMRMVKTGGVLAYLTPTSFLGGQYFKALRQLLADEMTPTAFDFISDRNGVFDDVLQETLLTTYVKEKNERATAVSVIVPEGSGAIRVQAAGEVRIEKGGQPWLLPRQTADVGFLHAISRMTTRLSTLGYSVSTGPLVWNRHKKQLRTTAGRNNLPLIWAESLTTTGFAFSAGKRNHVPYIAVRKGQLHLVTKLSAVLVQRTTSKEQRRRLLAGILSQRFLDAHGGAVIENHLNVVYTAPGTKPKVGLKTINALLNTAAVDRAFRCISGSVAVSAYELNALPLPSIDQLLKLERLMREGVDHSAVERMVASFYGVD